MTIRRARLGREGEEAAWAAYRRRGYRLVARNWRCLLGEIDLVVRCGATVVFCEVKTRSSETLGGPFDGVTPAKQRRIRALAEAFLATSGTAAERYRFDVASVVQDGRGRARVHLFEDAF